MPNQVEAATIERTAISFEVFPLIVCVNGHFGLEFYWQGKRRIVDAHLLESLMDPQEANPHPKSLQIKLNEQGVGQLLAVIREAERLEITPRQL